MKETKIATLQINLKKANNNRDELVAWLHEKAEEIKKLNVTEYVDKPKWNFFI